jgi:hypothetical protein
MPRRIIRTITTAIAIAALTAPTALARPADTPPAKAAAATQEQDARSGTSEYPTRPAQGEQANPRLNTTRSESMPKPAADDGIAWTTIGLGIGIAGGLLAIGAIAAMTRRTRRTGRARITA